MGNTNVTLTTDNLLQYCSGIDGNPTIPLLKQANNNTAKRIIPQQKLKTPLKPMRKRKLSPLFSPKKKKTKKIFNNLVSHEISFNFDDILKNQSPVKFHKKPRNISQNGSNKKTNNLSTPILIKESDLSSVDQSPPSLREDPPFWTLLTLSLIQFLTKKKLTKTF